MGFPFSVNIKNREIREKRRNRRNTIKISSTSSKTGIGDFIACACLKVALNILTV